MKKFITAGVIFLLILMSFQNNYSASEMPKLKIFGVGSVVKAVQGDEYLIATKGEKPEEGFVYTPQEPFTTKEIKYQITLKGSGPVYMKMEETDARGQFIKEKSLKITLTNQWKTYELPFQLKDVTSQIDVMVITAQTNKTEFAIKNLQIKNQ